jgi:hypothetical protein
VLRKIVVPKWGKVTADCRKLHNEERHDSYSLSNIVQVIILTLGIL